MNLNLNIDNYGGKSVVPVKCREVQGTAFYIGNGYLLTAYHVVSDAEYDRSSIIVTIDGKDVLCELMKIGDIMDVALYGAYNEAVFSMVGENGRKALRTKGFKYDRENGLNISKRFSFT